MFRRVKRPFKRNRKTCRVLLNSLILMTILFTCHHYIKSRTDKKQCGLPCSEFRPNLSEQHNETNFMTKTAQDQLIETLQNIELEIVVTMTKKKRKAVLVGLEDFENKGDAAIAVGELEMMAKLGIELIDYCRFPCGHNDRERMFKISEEFGGPKNVVIFGKGGGNFGSPKKDYLRYRMMQTFRSYDMIVLPQSVWFHRKKRRKATALQYSSHAHNLFMMRDRYSFRYISRYLPPSRFVLSPDSAFFVGSKARFFKPTVDIVWIKREDGEATKYKTPSFPSGISYTITDWKCCWPTPKTGKLFDNLYLQAYNGFLFLQRGRVVITDRLHGYIMSILLDIPTVIIDNRIKKLSHYRNTWTKGLPKVVMARGPTDALSKAKQLLEKYYDIKY